MNIELDALEARVIGCLIEKQITTPDQYPLSLNALVNACNQKSNRDPVLELDEASVQRTLDALAKKHFVVERSGFGSRVPKYQHRFCNTEYGTLKLDEQELAVTCELLLRGPQTPGELRSRASRMARFADVTDVEATLSRLAEREGGPFVTRLTREPGRRESRFAHLFGGPVSGASGSAGPAEEAGAAAGLGARSSFGGAGARAGTMGVAAPGGVGTPGAVGAAGGAGPSLSGPPEITFPASLNDERMAKLEAEVEQLRTELAELKKSLGR
jgi:uncharacterized protein YceH (UPF0502 family)